MGITTEERSSRKDSIGASDVPAILGISPFRTAADIYLEKTTNLNEADLSDSMAIRVGETVELSLVKHGYDIAVDHFDEVRLGELVYDYKVVGDSGAPKHANLDGMATDAETGKPYLVIEAKTTSVPEHWGPSWSQKIPPHVYAQVQWQMGLLGVNHSLVVTLLSAYRLELRTYMIPFNQELFKMMCKTCDDFWFGFVETRTKPPMSLPNRSTLNLIQRDPDKETTITTVAYNDLVRAKERMKAAASSLEDCQRAVISELDEFEIGVCDEGIVTYKEQQKKEYTVKASASRVLRVKKAKEVKDGN